MSTDKYVNFISSQVKRERTMGFRAYDSVTEQAESLQEAAAMEVHGDPDDDSYKHIDKIHAHIKAAGHTIHHDDEGKATKDPHVTAHYERGDDRKTGSPSGFTIHPKAHGDKKLMTMVKGFHKKYGE